MVEVNNASNSSDNPDAKRLEAQAQLKGSVGGVQALLQIQQSVAQGLTDINAAVVIISEIYGIESSLARQMVGTPEIITPDSVISPTPLFVIKPEKLIEKFQFTVSKFQTASFVITVGSL